MGARWIIFIVSAGLASTCCLCGCAPKQPKMATQPKAEIDSTTNTSTEMGSFNLQKRHGLGGWSKPAGPSEVELLKHIAATQAAPNDSNPIQPGKGTR